MEHRDEIEFDLVQLMRFLLKKAWIIVLALLVSGVVGFLVSKLLTTPTYTTSCRLYVYDENKEMSYNDLVIATQLTNDCEIIITGQNVTKPVIEKLGLKMTPEALGKRIVVGSEDNTRVLHLEYTDTNPERAALILNEICAEAASQIQTVMKVDAVTQLYAAEVPTSPSSAGPGRDALLFGLIGAVMAIAILVVIFLLDDTIRSEDDVTRYLGLSTLGAIPSSEELGAPRKAGEAANGKGVARFAKK